MSETLNETAVFNRHTSECAFCDEVSESALCAIGRPLYEAMVEAMRPRSLVEPTEFFDGPAIVSIDVAAAQFRDVDRQRRERQAQSELDRREMYLDALPEETQ